LNNHKNDPINFDKKLAVAFKYILNHHDDDRYVTGEKLVNMLEFYQKKVKSYHDEIEHAKHDYQLSDEERKVKISEFVEKEH